MRGGVFSQSTRRKIMDRDDGCCVAALDYLEARIAVQPNGCWLWTLKPYSTGYAMANVNGCRESAHRLSYRLVKGPIPVGLVLDHVCHNNDPDCFADNLCPHRRCVNPDHLEAVPPRTNSLRGKTTPAANALKTTCPRGHAYGHVDPKRGWRKCFECKNEQVRAGQTVRGKYATECVNGHAYTPENTLKVTKGRACRECNRLRLADRRAEARA